jgi:hypothetical protein
MKAFEKWENLSVPNCNSSDRVCPIHNSCERCERATGWRAAYKEILSWYREMEDDDWDYIACVVRERLKAELEDK